MGRRKTDNAMRLVKKATGLSSIYYCPFCTYRDLVEGDSRLTFKNGLRGLGRGHGLRSGAIGTSKVAAHIRRVHPEKVTIKEPGHDD